ncbi:MAG TPA: CorA family divalent cation transporter [Candidatus Nanoarchaeia archaeon]|nr:CorA family divalent cation transporter [Candidatus Nanoarchaeia archaeon]
MERIILVCGGDKKVVEHYTPKSLSRLERSPAIPFWLDLQCPSERFLRRISIPFGFDPRSVQACFSRPRSRSCKDFGNYLFIETCLLEPSQKTLFIRSDLKIFLSKERLITIRSRRTPLYRLFPGLRDSPFLDTGRLLLTIFDESISALLQSFSPEYEPKTAGLWGDGQPSKDRLWWRLRNFRAALLSHVKIMHEPVFLGTWLFGPEDKGMINSIKAKISFLCDMTFAMLCRFDSPAFIQELKKGKAS